MLLFFLLIVITFSLSVYEAYNPTLPISFIITFWMHFLIKIFIGALLIRQNAFLNLREYLWRFFLLDSFENKIF